MASKSLVIGQEEAVKLLSELGYEDAEDFSVSKLNNTLKKVLGEFEDEEEEPDLSKKSKKLFDQVLKAKVVKVSDSEEDEEEEEKPKQRGRKSKASAKPSRNGSPKKKGASKAAPRDKFGSREGTESAAINAEISKKPISIEKLVGKFKKMRKGRVRSHLRFLEERGFITVKNGKVLQK